jgi:hypothetical protein
MLALPSALVAARSGPPLALRAFLMELGMLKPAIGVAQLASTVVCRQLSLPGGGR